ncbi:MAG: hypothetical protein LUI07_10170 [Lachnospiraceae bacterium]|nr:hypothetical protein [Lachnospiraceae bacterium]
MSTEDKRTEHNKNLYSPSKSASPKITPIRFPYDESDDPVIDDFILQGLQEEADEAERRINSDPELSKITAPDGQYDKIVARLKAMGVWQEDEDEPLSGNEAGLSCRNGTEAEGEQKIRTGNDIQNEANKTGNKNEIENEIADEIENRTKNEAKNRIEMGNDIKNGTENGIETATENEIKNGIENGTKNEVENGTETENDIRNGIENETENKTKNEVENEIENKIENKTEYGTKNERGNDIENTGMNLEMLYRMLPEEDRRAIEREHERQNRKRGKKEKRSRYLKKIVKRGGIVAAAFVLVFGVSMNVTASRRLILRMWESVVDNIATRTVTDNVEEENTMESANPEHYAAMKEIEEITGIPGINFNYWSSGMEYLEYAIHDDGTEAHVFYSYGDTIICLYMRNPDSEATSYYVSDSDTELEMTIENLQGTEVKIWSVNPDQEGESYMAEFEYKDFRYVISGELPFEEIEELVKHMDFLS